MSACRVSCLLSSCMSIRINQAGHHRLLLDAQNDLGRLQGKLQLELVDDELHQCETPQGRLFLKKIPSPLGGGRCFVAEIIYPHAESVLPEGLVIRSAVCPDAYHRAAAIRMNFDDFCFCMIFVWHIRLLRRSIQCSKTN